MEKTIDTLLEKHGIRPIKAIMTIGNATRYHATAFDMKRLEALAEKLEVKVQDLIDWFMED